MKAIFISGILFFSSSGCFAESLKTISADEWPRLKSFEESECLVPEENKVLVKADLSVKQYSLFAKFLLQNIKGEVYINPQVKKGYSSLSFSLEKVKQASAVETYRYDECYKRIDLEINAYPENYKKLYIIVNNVVLYDFSL